MEYHINTILYPTSLGPHKLEAFYHAAGMALRFGAKVHIIHAVEPISLFTQTQIDNELDPAIRREGHEAALKDLQLELEQFCQDTLQSEAHTVIAGTKVIEGQLDKVILEEAERLNADLIVLGSHVHSAIMEVLLGSLPHKITLRSTRPVLLIPQDEK